MVRKLTVLIVIAVIVFALVPVPKQETIDAYSLPLPYNLPSGVVIKRGSLRFLFNNGHLEAWHSGGHEVYVFEWTDEGWKEKKIIKNVIADLVKCIKAPVKIKRDKTLKLAPENRSIESVKESRTFSGFSYARVNSGNNLGSLFFKADVFVFFPSINRVREFVRNKVPNKHLAFIHTAFAYNNLTVRRFPFRQVVYLYKFICGGEI